VPTVAESGYKVYEADLWYGLFCAGEGAEMRQRDDPIDVRFVVGSVHHISDLFVHALCAVRVA
jgi:hypothetical protein